MRGAVNACIIAFMTLLLLSSGADLTLGVLDAVGVSLQQMELEEIAQEVERFYQETATLPSSRSFARFCAGRIKNHGRPDGTDRWGTPYHLETSRFAGRSLNHPRALGEYVLVSAGPDRQWNTGDDVHVKKSERSLTLGAPDPPTPAPEVPMRPGEIWPPRR